MKNDYSEKRAPQKKKKNSCSEEIAALAGNCCVQVVTLKKFEEVASPKIKLSWKSRNIWKKKKIPNETSDYA